ncbi:MAG: endolytic transglycosylase MltG [Armatimonadota bacterium]|nr:endolytic transglycosylase MltG [bacterium]MDW8320412.1 endolytic transglycosylase MltG [Armatimonadota bacterium]
MERQSTRRKWLWATIVVGLAVLLLATAAWLWWQLQPVGAGTLRLVRITPGMNARQIGQKLQAQGIIRSARMFEWVVRFKGWGGRLKPGTYELRPDMSPVHVARLIAEGKVATSWVTIPEGYTVRQIAQLMQERGVADAEEFLSLATQQGDSFSASFPLPRNLEGYLFPNTYRLPQGTGARAAIQSMVSLLDREVYQKYHSEIERSGFTFHQILTIASMIEREAKVAADRPLISAVIRNRLQRGMKLEIDATVLYALGKHKSRVLYRDLEIDSDYNTYRRKGLPPGPIANPGVACIEAALRPAQVDYLYYVARPDGSHIFTRTLQEHHVAIARARAERTRATP